MQKHVDSFVLNFQVYAAVAAILAAVLSLFSSPTPAFIVVSAISAPAVSFICQTKIGSPRYNYPFGLIALVIVIETLEKVDHQLVFACLVGALASVLIGAVRSGIIFYQGFRKP
ncbi:MAG: hypothetical protein KGS72_25865 [Cyanobacteria bacterium REEB67]|nr:hypothetical protein [Cyanobacteria bacterium REEB67]